MFFSSQSPVLRLITASKFGESNVVLIISAALNRSSQAPHLRFAELHGKNSTQEPPFRRGINNQDFLNIVVLSAFFYGFSRSAGGSDARRSEKAERSLAYVLHASCVLLTGKMPVLLSA